MASLDSMDQLGKEVECSICLCTWSDPKTLPCSHVFCEKCLIPLINETRRPMISCPECRITHLVPPEGLHRAWPTQRALINLANSMRDLAVIDIGRTSTSVKVDPNQSFVDVRRSEKVRVGAVCCLIVILRDVHGNSIDPRNAQNQVKAFVELKPRPRKFPKEAISLTTSHNGECFVMYQTANCGIHEFTVLVGDARVRNTPLEVEVAPKGLPGCEIKGPLKGPRDVAFWGENFLVTDGIEKAVFLVDHAGRELKKLNIQMELMRSFSPMAISTYKQKVFVTDMGNSCIHVYNDIDGDPRQFGAEYLQKPTGIVVSSDNGNIFVVDNARKYVLLFGQNDDETKLIRVIQFFPNSKELGLINPQMVAINSRGNQLLIADQDDGGHNCIKVFNVTKNKIERKINVGLGQLQTKPYGIAVGRDDIVYVAVRVVPSGTSHTKVRMGGPRRGPTDRGAGGDHEFGRNPRGLVITYNIMGHFLGVFGNLPYQLDGPGGLIIAEDADPPSIAYVADSPGHGRNGSLKGFVI